MAEVGKACCASDPTALPQDVTASPPPSILPGPHIETGVPSNVRAVAIGSLLRGGLLRRFWDPQNLFSAANGYCAKSQYKESTIL